MELEKLLEYYQSTTTVPLALYNGHKWLENNNFTQSHSDFIARKVLKHLPQTDLCKMYLTDERLMFGCIRISNSERYIVLGPVAARENHVPANLHGPIPVLSGYRLKNHMVLLAYIVNPQEPPHFPSEYNAFRSPVSDEDDGDNAFFHDSLEYERLAMAAVEHGRTQEIYNMFGQDMVFDVDIGITANDFLRSQKNVFVVAATMVSRAAVRGGMDYETAMMMSDEYLQTMERLNSYGEVHSLTVKMIMEYTKIVENIRCLHTDSKLIRKVCDYVSRHVCERIRAENIASEIGLNTAYLSYIFKKHAGIGLNSYINEQKINEAKHLLASSNKPIIEISEMLGFSSQCYFHTVFKKMTGSTPAAYRGVHE